MDMLRRGSEYLYSRLNETAATQVTYTRPGVGSCTPLATFGARSEAAEDATGVEVWTKKPDFIIRRDQLVIGYKKIEPVVGDRIKTVVDGVEQVYEVVSIDDGEPPYRQSDRWGQSWRIHTSRISVNV